MELTFTHELPNEKNMQTHTWAAVGEFGGVHIWARPSAFDFSGEEFYGGVEVHSRKPMYGGDEPAHNDHCWLLNGPCWHDGSSLYFSEWIEPALRGKKEFGPDDDRFINRILRDWYARNLAPQEATL